jgi:hypothetical protein
MVDHIQPPVAVVVDKYNIDGGGQQAATGNLRLSVSEPAGGYPTRDEATPTPNDYEKSQQVYVQPFAEPLDQRLNGGLWPTLAQDGTYWHFRTIHLQRLANPLQPWDARMNPYLTIDSMPVDLRTFNGVPETTGHEGPDVIPAGAPTPDNTAYFRSHERGEYTTDNNIWAGEQIGSNVANHKEPKTKGTVNNIVNHKFNVGLEHTFGYLNYQFTTAGTPRDSGTGGAYPQYKGDTDKTTPFPWLTWNNRPFISELELLLVPTVSARRLVWSPDDDPNPPPVPDVYPFGRRFDVAIGSDPYANQNEPFPHLMNFFFQGTSSTAIPPGFHRVLEFLYVPSPFVGAEIQGNPVAFADTTYSHAYYPPFNRVPNYREPGRINLNTIFSDTVWYGLMGEYPGFTTTAFRNNFAWSRRGYGNASDTQFATNNAYPTRFANPFRSYAGAQLSALPMLPADLTPPPTGTGGEIHATLLRRNPGATTAPLFVTASGSNVVDTNRNPFFRYQAMQRLANLVTTRSNVYAVWITVGNFEVESNPSNPPVDAAHPDGYRLGRELGSDTGDIKRHRAFYLIDRSIPVGFSRGRDYNAGNTILLKRYIE